MYYYFFADIIRTRTDEHQAFAVGMFFKTGFNCFYGISIIVGYLMPTLLYTYILNIYDFLITFFIGSKYCSVSLRIQLNISHLFTHI